MWEAAAAGAMKSASSSSSLVAELLEVSESEELDVSDALGGRRWPAGTSAATRSDLVAAGGAQRAHLMPGFLSPNCDPAEGRNACASHVGEFLDC